MAGQPYHVFTDLIDLLDIYYDDPVAFVEDILKVEAEGDSEDAELSPAVVELEKK